MYEYFPRRVTAIVLSIIFAYPKHDRPQLSIFLHFPDITRQEIAKYRNSLIEISHETLPASINFAIPATDQDFHRSANFTPKAMSCLRNNQFYGIREWSKCT